MSIFFLNITLALAWAALLGQFSSANLLTGFVLGYLMIWLMQFAIETTVYVSKFNQIVRFVTTFIWELIKSNFRVAYSVFKPDSIQPGIVAVPLDLKTDLGIMVLANVITLTPGTLSIDVSDDNQVLFVHTMYADTPENVRHDVKEVFETRVREVFES